MRFKLVEEEGTRIEKENQKENACTSMVDTDSNKTTHRSCTPTTVMVESTECTTSATSSANNDKEEDEEESTLQRSTAWPPFASSMQETQWSNAAFSKECNDIPAESSNSSAWNNIERAMAVACANQDAPCLHLQQHAQKKDNSTMADLLHAALLDIVHLQEANKRAPVSNVDPPLPAGKGTAVSSSQPQTEATTIRQLTVQKQHIIANMKKTKRLLEHTERQLERAEHAVQLVSEEKQALQQQVAQVTESRDALKMKVCHQQEIVKDTRNGMLELKLRLLKTEQMRALENELLDNFRKLAIHTG